MICRQASHFDQRPSVRRRRSPVSGAIDFSRLNQDMESQKAKVKRPKSKVLKARTLCRTARSVPSLWITNEQPAQTQGLLTFSFRLLTSDLPFIPPYLSAGTDALATYCRPDRSAPRASRGQARVDKSSETETTAGRLG